MKTVIFGAGQVGRGFLGDICHQSGYEIVFVDLNRELVEQLNRRRGYPLWLLDENRTEKEITGVSALALDDAEGISRAILESELAFTAVGANNLAGLARVLAPALAGKARARPGSRLDIVICENLLGAARVLGEALAAEAARENLAGVLEMTGLVESVVSRMVAPTGPREDLSDPLLVTVEPYNILPVARGAFRGPIPPVAGFKPVDDLFPWEELKLFVHNLGHAGLAYLGHLRNHEFIWQALADPAVRPFLEGVFRETGAALGRKHSFPAGEIEAYQADLRRRFANRALNDTVARVGRDPLRKIGPGERLAGAVRLCLSQGVEPRSALVVLAACLCYNNTAGDESAARLQALIRERGIPFVLSDICRLDDPGTIESVSSLCREMKSGSFPGPEKAGPGMP